MSLSPGDAIPGSFFDALDPLVEAQAWSPTVGGWTPGNAVMNARYLQLGKLVYFSLSWTLGTTTSTSASGLSFTAPVAAASSDGLCAGAVVFFDGSTRYIGGGIQILGGNFLPLAVANTSTLTVAAVINTRPFSWGNGDEIRMSGVYEAA